MQIKVRTARHGGDGTSAPRKRLISYRFKEPSMGVSEAKVTLVTGPGNQSDCARIKEVRMQQLRSGSRLLERPVGGLFIARIVDQNHQRDRGAAKYIEREQADGAWLLRIC